MLLLTLAVSGCAAEEAGPEESDAYLWLEEIDGERALDWVKAQNASTAERLKAHKDSIGVLTDTLRALPAPACD